MDRFIVVVAVLSAFTAGMVVLMLLTRWARDWYFESFGPFAYWSVGIGAVILWTWCGYLFWKEYRRR